LLVGFGGSDDACVYQVTDDVAIIETVDFFTPMVDDPVTFGEIAAANSLSDVYAMGGEPKLCMNLLCAPNCLPDKVLRDILLGGHQKAIEAGCVIAGGHTVEDPEPKYGMCVTGFVHPDKVWKNAGAHVGDVLVLTKPLGVGIAVTAAKVDEASQETIDDAVESMRTLNREAAMVAREVGGIHACTDVTGFGLFGHALEMAEGSDLTLQIFASQLPIVKGVVDLAEDGMIPGGAYRNRDHVDADLFVHEDVPEAMEDICSDPQTSGGLLLAMPEENAKAYLSRYPRAVIMGRVVEKGEKYLELLP